MKSRRAVPTKAILAESQWCAERRRCGDEENDVEEVDTEGVPSSWSCVGDVAAAADGVVVVVFVVWVRIKKPSSSSYDYQ